jgi:hypothetical protein
VGENLKEDHLGRLSVNKIILMLVLRETVRGWGGLKWLRIRSSDVVNTVNPWVPSNDGEFLCHLNAHQLLKKDSAQWMVKNVRSYHVCFAVCG